MSSQPQSPENGSRMSGAVKRILRELKEMQSNDSSDFKAYPLETNLFEWHFSIQGPADTEFEGGIYHGRIMLPSGYPFKPPDIMLLTPSGRFEIGKKICLSISGYHPEYWQPSWSIRTVLVALIAFMPTDPQGAIGSLNYSQEERRVLAKESISWSCSTCGSSNATCFDSVKPSTNIPNLTIEGPSAEALSPPVIQEQTDQAIQDHSSNEVPELRPKMQNTSSHDIFWTSLIIVLLTAILAILIKKAIAT